MKLWKNLMGIVCVMAMFSACSQATAPNDKPATGPTTCVISGKKLDNTAFVYTHTDEDTKEKSEAKLCCEDCVAKFKEDPDLHLAQISNQIDGYKTSICVVSDEPLGSMGKPIIHKHKDGDKEITVKFCCGGCVDDFKEDPEKFLAKLEAATKDGAPEAKPTTIKTGDPKQETKPEVKPRTADKQEKPENK